MRTRLLFGAAFATIDAVSKYAEGRGVRLEVKTKKMPAAVQTLAVVKMA